MNDLKALSSTFDVLIGFTNKYLTDSSLSLVLRHTLVSFFLVKNNLILLGTTPRSLDDFGFKTIGWWVSSGP